MNCQLKKGIFRQRTCNNNSQASCNKCGIQICNQHSKEFNGTLLCLNCLSKEQDLKSDQLYDSYLESDKDFYLWYWLLRSEYDNEYGIDAFDETDYSGFYTEESELSYDHDMEQDDFLDS